MSKKFFMNPCVLASIGGEGDIVIDIPGSGQGGQTAYEPMSYNDWLDDIFEDYNYDEEVDEKDYVLWWQEMMSAQPEVFTSALFDQLNPGWNGERP